MPRGVILRFAKGDGVKLYLQELNGDFVLSIVEHGVTVESFNFFRDREEADSAFERARNGLF